MTLSYHPDLHLHRISSSRHTQEAITLQQSVHILKSLTIYQQL